MTAPALPIHAVLPDLLAALRAGSYALACCQSRSIASCASSSAIASGDPMPRRYWHRRGMKWS